MSQELTPPRAGCVWQLGVSQEPPKFKMEPEKEQEAAGVGSTFLTI
jgi:hypothetical protein